MYGAGIMLVALLAGMLFAAFILRPLDQLAAAARAIGAGNLDARVPTGRRDELGDVGNAFNAMAARIQQHAKPGQILISTRTLRAAGHTVRVGGHGFLLGDEGGGYWIGREAVRAALRAADGTGPATALTAVVQLAFGSLAGAETEVHRHPTERGLLSRLVPDVAAAAAGPDAEAARILAEAAAYLAELATAVRARLGDLPVAGVGGIFRCAPVREAFRAATDAAEPVEPPELGALRLLDQA